MARMRLVDEALVAAWHDGLVPGEYHSGIGEEGINAGVVMHLRDNDAMALDHRSTAPFIGRGADPVALMAEVLGSEEGMNRGRAGHMHLLAPELNAMADGIVGSSGPLAAGSAIANAHLHPGSVSIAFHGEAAMNQGMLMEAYNLAVAWNLPVVFVCKDNRWSITTYSADVTGGDVIARAASFGLAIEKVRGHKVDEVAAAAGRLIERARTGRGPGFLYATCHRPGGHFEGDPIVRLLQRPRRQAAEWGPGIRDGLTAPAGGARRRDRLRALGVLTRRGVRAMADWNGRTRRDPLHRARKMLDEATAAAIDVEEGIAVEEAMAAARSSLGVRPTFGGGR